MQWSGLFTSATFFVAVLFSSVLQAQWLLQSRDIMGTRVTVELWSEDKPTGERCSERVFAEMKRIDAEMSPFKPDSEISRINRLASQHPVEVSRELYLLLQRAQWFSQLTDGVFDITFASVGYRYDYRQHLKPDDQTIEQEINRIDYKKMTLQNGTIHFGLDGMRIDLGGIAKGYAVDRSIDILQQCGISQALVSAGGDSRILGDRQGRPWMIGIQHPRKKQSLALSIPLSDSAISTSGDYERYFISNGERVHHIIDPKTGRSAHDSWSATIIGPNATSTDALSTSVFILGAQKGLQLIDSMAGFDAIIIDSNGVVHYSSGLQEPATVH
jgi:thiamine biosynthesis lipoprotein